METANYSQIPKGTFDAPHLDKTLSPHVLIDKSKGSSGGLHTILGYVCLLMGFLIIAGNVQYTFRVFTKQAEPPRLFNFEGIKLDLSKLSSSVPMSEGVKKIMKDNNIDITQIGSLPSTPTEILPSTMVNEVSNIGAYMFLASFLLNVGYKMASLGVKLIRPIYIKA